MKMHFPLAACLLLAGGISAQAQNPNTLLVVIDENGNGTLGLPSSGLTTLTGFLSSDPGPGGLSNVLTYTLPFAGLPGDILLVDSDPAGAVSVQDILRFNGDGTVRFYSDNSNGSDSPADSGLPTGRFQNTFPLPEVGPEGSNGSFYIPTSGQPGYDPVIHPVYRFVSDSPVPETSSGVGLGVLLGLAGLTVFLRRRKMSV